MDEHEGGNARQISQGLGYDTGMAGEILRSGGH